MDQWLSAAGKRDCLRAHVAKIFEQFESFWQWHHVALAHGFVHVRLKM